MEWFAPNEPADELIPPTARRLLTVITPRPWLLPASGPLGIIEIVLLGGAAGFEVLGGRLHGQAGQDLSCAPRAYGDESRCPLPWHP
jgi:hypothetical protein